MEFSLLWAALTAALLGWLGLRLWPGGQPPRAFDHLLGATVAGLATGRLFAMVSQGVNPITNPVDIIVIRGGVDTAAASLGFVSALLWSTRSASGAVDGLAPAATLGLAGWHAGCLWRDACLGTVSDLPWAWAQAGSEITRHPTEIYAAIGLGLAAWVVSHLPWKPWLRSVAAVGFAGLVRLSTEPLRPSLSNDIVWWYLAATAVGILLALVSIMSNRAGRLESLPDG